MTALHLFPIGALALNVFVGSFAFGQRHTGPGSRALVLIAAWTAAWSLCAILPHLPFSANMEPSLTTLCTALWMSLGIVYLHFLYRLSTRPTDTYFWICVALTAIAIPVCAIFDQIAPGRDSLLRLALKLSIPGISALFGLYVISRKKREFGAARTQKSLQILTSGAAVAFALGLAGHYAISALVPAMPTQGLAWSLACTVLCFFSGTALSREIQHTVTTTPVVSELFHHLRIGIVLLDTNGNTIYLNPEASVRLSENPNTAKGQEIEKLIATHPKARKIESRELSLETPMGSRFLLATASKLRRHNAEVGTLVLLRDISDQREIADDLKSTHDALQIEAKIATEKLRDAKNKDVVFELAEGIAHDFNNILSAIMGFATAAREDLPEDSQLRIDMDEILSAAAKARDIVDQLLTFNIQDADPESIDVNDVIENTRRLLSVSLSHNIDIEYDIYPERICVLGDAMQLTKIVMYFCTKAYESLKETGGHLRIRAEKIHLSDSFTGEHPPLSPGPHVRFEVADSSRNNENNCVTVLQTCQEFVSHKRFRNDPKGEISAIFTVIQKHRGIAVQTSGGDIDTTVHVYFPAFVESARDTDVGELGIPGGNERILLVDDEDQLTRVGKRLLEPLGYSVTALTNSQEASRIFLENPDLFDIVITDQTMPGMSGLELADTILAVRKNIPIILLSGHAEVPMPPPVSGLGIGQFISKPVSKYRLGMAVRELLDRDGREEL